MNAPSIPSVSYCTLAKNRRWQLELTLEANLCYLQGHSAELVVLDWESTDGLRDWILKRFEPELHKGILKYRHCHSRASFNINIGKNFAHRLGTGRVLFNLDADNFAEGTFSTLRDLSEDAVLGCKEFLRGTYGRIGMYRTKFMSLGGYDECFLPVGHGDMDLLARAVASGLRYVNLPAARPAIPNKKSETIRFCDTSMSWKAMERSNAKRSQQNLRRRILTANKLGWFEAIIKDHDENVFYLGRGHRLSAVPILDPKARSRGVSEK